MNKYFSIENPLLLKYKSFFQRNHHKYAMKGIQTPSLLAGLPLTSFGYHLEEEQKRNETPLIGLVDKPLGKATRSVRIQVKSATDDSFVISMDALVMRSIMSDCPQFESKLNR